MSIRKQLLITVALLVLGAVAWFAFDTEAPARLAAPGGAAHGNADSRTAGRGGAVTVVTAKAAMAPTNDVVSAIGTAKALRSVVLYPRAAGTVMKIDFKPGDFVRKGAVLAELDSESEQIARDRAALEVQTAQERVDRYTLLQEGSAVSQVQMTEAERALFAAQLALRDATATLDKRRIVAPFDGIVGLSELEVGAVVSTADPVASLDQRDELKVEFRVPEKYAARIAPRQAISATSAARPGDTFVGAVSAVASRVEEDSRTLQVQATIANPDDTLRPGMSFAVQMRFEGEEHVSIPPLAIQWDREGAYVWTIADGKAMREPVKIVERNAADVLVETTLEAGDAVVIEGVQKLRPGIDVAQAGEDGNEAARQQDQPSATPRS